MFTRQLLTYSILSLIALGGFFGSVHIETEEHSIMSISYESDGVYAADFTGPCPDGRQPTSTGCDTTSTDQLKMWNSLIDGLNIILGIITAIVSPAIMFAGWLMSPDWTSGDLFGLRAPMYSLWVTVSNIVYFVYAILLILIALGTMFGKESFSYKVMLPKLALGILMVPFTWWFVQWTISLSAVVTASVITIPAETMAKLDTNGKSWMSTPSIPKNITINDLSFKKDSLADTSKTKCDGGNCIAPIDVINKSAGMYGYMMVYAYSVFKFQEVKNLPQGIDILKTGLGIVHQGIIAAIMFLVFGLLTLALVAMLLVRAIKLWVYAIFSPLFTFQFVAGSAMMGENKDTFTIKEFVGLCFVPAIVGLALSFGLIMINAVGSGSSSSAGDQCTPDMIKGEGCKIISIAGNTENSITRKIEEFGNPEKARTQNIIKFGGVTTTFEGKAGAAIDPAVEAAGASGTISVLNSAGGVFGTLIIDIIALVFIWLAFMAAKNVSKAVSMAVQPFEDIGKKVGSLAASIPKYTPIPGLDMSTNSIGKVVNNAENAMIGASDKKFKESAAGKLFGGDKVVAQVDEKVLAESIKKAGTSTTHPEWKNVGAVIEKQNGKDIEYSSIFKDLAGGLKGFQDRSDKIRALETTGYTNANAQVIVDQLAKKGNELDKNDTTLMAALRSRIGAPAAGGGAGSSTGFTATTVLGDTKKMEVKIDNIKMQMNTDGSAISTLSDDSKKKLAETIKGLTEDEFKSKFSGISDAAIKAIVEEAKKTGGIFKDK